MTRSPAAGLRESLVRVRSAGSECGSIPASVSGGGRCASKAST